MSKSLVVMRKVCEWCGSEFDAFTKSTKYCSHVCNCRAYKANARLQKKVSVEKVTDEIIKNKPIEKFKDNEFLKCAQAAVLLGVCKQTIYNLIYSKQLKAVRLSSRMTVIRRKDIDELLQIAEPFEKQQKAEPKPLTEFYSLIQISEKFNVKTRQIWAIITRYKMPTIKIGRFTHVSQKHIDKYFLQKNKTTSYSKNAVKPTVVKEDVPYYLPRVANQNYLTN